MTADSVTVPTIDAALVKRLVAAQFPQWAELPVRPVEVGGWDNRTFHLGDAMTVRLPSAPGYVAAVAKEQRWLPELAPHLPLPIPLPLGKGVPGEGYPFPWTVNRWLPGETATPDRIGDLTAFATTLAGFVTALQAVDATDGPTAGAHSFYRGGPLTTYDAETRKAIDTLASRVDERAVTEVWEAALDATWHGPPVWFHGDVAYGNLLVRDGKLAAVIDFGTSGVGDPACDTVISWTMFSGASRQAYWDALAVDDATLARGRGWALWKALITLAEHIDTNPAAAATPRRDIDAIVADHQRSA